MVKVRVYELAKKLGIENKELLAKLAEAGVDVASHASSLSDEDLQKFESFNRPVKEKVEEERIKPGLIRRRRTVVAAPKDETDSKNESDIVADKDENAAEKTDGQQAPVTAATQTPVAPAESPAEDPDDAILEETPEKIETEVIEDAPPAKPEQEKEEIEAVSSGDDNKAKDKIEPVKQPQPQSVTEDRAKILGRVELPKKPANGQKKQDQQERQARPARQPKPSSAPARGRVRADLSTPLPVEQPLPEKEGRNTKKRKKSRRNDDQFDQKEGQVSRRGRRVEVFEPGRGGQKRRKSGRGAKPVKNTEVTVSKAIKRIIKISDSITVGELAKRMGVKANELIAELMRQGSMVTINHPLDYESAAILASEFNYEVENIAFDEETILDVALPKEKESSAADLKTRPPVVTIMGHVDHGKTSLLDAIREANVTEGEAGGITQHIGAYDVDLDGRKITFLDTPGHEAFTAMRARGAGVTDIVILVVAADDGVMPQTREAINHAKAAGVPIIIAVNKIDKPEANPERIKQGLTEFELVPEEWGGETIFVEVSAKMKMNLDNLLEMILLQAEVLELQANPDKRAKGSIVEARLDKGRGPVATVLVQDGTLKVGDSIVAGLHYGRVRTMTAANGIQVKEAGPSFPVEVTGLGGVPDAGETFNAVDSEKSAKEVSQHRQSKQRELDLAKSSKASLEQLFARMQEGVVEELAVIIKADVQGSVEAVRDALEKLSTDTCRLNVIHTGVGGISESDVTLATASNAIVLGFNVRPEVKARTLADSEKVDIRLYSIIYDAVNDVRNAMEGLLAPTLKEKHLGRVEVRETFHVSRVGTIAGCYVLDGKIVRNSKVRLIRDNVVVWEGNLSSLKRFKDDVKEVLTGYECGIGLENYNDVKVGDTIEAFEIEEVKTTL
ncbi:MAG: translation initiation factor IF-2 [Pelovirga sp.]